MGVPSAWCCKAPQAATSGRASMRPDAAADDVVGQQRVGIQQQKVPPPRHFHARVVGPSEARVVGHVEPAHFGVLCQHLRPAAPLGVVVHHDYLKSNPPGVVIDSRQTVQDKLRSAVVDNDNGNVHAVREGGMGGAKIKNLRRCAVASPENVIKR